MLTQPYWSQKCKYTYVVFVAPPTACSLPSHQVTRPHLGTEEVLVRSLGARSQRGCVSWSFEQRRPPGGRCLAPWRQTTAQSQPRKWSVYKYSNVILIDTYTMYVHVASWLTTAKSSCTLINGTAPHTNPTRNLKASLSALIVHGSKIQCYIYIPYSPMDGVLVQPPFWVAENSMWNVHQSKSVCRVFTPSPTDLWKLAC